MGIAKASPDVPVSEPGRLEERLEERRSGAACIAWALPLMLLFALGVLLWQLWRPLAPIVVERDMPVPPPEDPVPAAWARLAALKSELAAVQGVRADLAALCRPIPKRGGDPPEPDPRPGKAMIEPSLEPLPPKQHELPAMIGQPEPEPAPQTAPPIRLRSPPELPSEIPRVSELPPRIGELRRRRDRRPLCASPAGRRPSGRRSW